MNESNARQGILKVISVLILIGGLVRLFAGRKIFESFLISELWSSHPYFIYVYRVLGSFVVFVGAMLFMIAHDSHRNAKLLAVCGYSFSFIACVMFLNGLFLKISFLHYAFDFSFCIIVACVCFSLSRQRMNMLADNK